MTESESKELIEFCQLVAEMRVAQMEAHRTGLFSKKETAKRHEAKVDKMLRDVLAENRTLF